MLDLASKIVLCLALAAALGALVAWLLRGILLGEASQAVEQTLREQVAHRDTELLGLKGRFCDLETRAASLDSERQDANTEIVVLAKSLEAEKAAHGVARSDADAWQSRHATIAAELGSAAAALLALRTEHAALVTAHDVQQATLAEHTARTAALEEELATLRAEANAAHRTESEELNTLKNDLATAKRQLHEKASALTTAEGRIVDAFREIDRLRATITERTTERDDAATARDAALTQAGTLRDELTAAQAAVTAHQTEAASLSTRVAELAPLAATLAAAQATLSSTREAHEKAVAGHASEVERLRARILALEPMEKLVPERDAEITRLRARITALEPVEKLVPERDAEITRLRARITALEPMEKLVPERDAEITRLRTRITALEPMEKIVPERDAEITRLRARITALEPMESMIPERDGEIVRLRQRIATLEPQAALLPDRDTRIRDLEGQVAICTRDHGDLGTLRARLVELEQFSQEDLRDNLEDIYGVGPKLAQLLYSLGINTFRQVASWTESDIDAMDLKLEDFHGRIRRENWVASAKEEYEKKYQRPFVPLRRA